MSDTTNNTEMDLTRRELLKKGAVLGGALVWAAPVVQVIGMRPAMAASTSPDCPNLYCLKAEVSGGSLGDFGPLGGGQGKGQGNCLQKNEDCDSNVPPTILAFLNANVTGDPESGFTVKLPPDCTLADITETTGSEDSFLGGVSAAARCGKKGFGNPCFVPAVDGNDLTFTCGNGTDISHIELIICCPAVP